MQSQVECQAWFLILSVGIIFVFNILIMLRIHQLCKRKRRLSESSRLKGLIIDEYSKIRHEYNNIAQMVINMIEAEDLNLLTEYKDTMLEKIHTLNSNSIAQLGKIKTERVFPRNFLVNINI
jgi:hypothetical protein